MSTRTTLMQSLIDTPSTYPNSRYTRCSITSRRRDSFPTHLATPKNVNKSLETQKTYSALAVGKPSEKVTSKYNRVFMVSRTVGRG